MKKIVLLLIIIINVRAFPQTACKGVIIGDRTSIAYAQSYIRTLKDNINDNEKDTLLPITDTFQLVDICIVDSVVILELHKPQINNDTLDTSLFIDRFYLLSKIGTIPTNGERVAVGKYYHLTIVPYFPYDCFVNIGSPGIPIILNDTSYMIWFVGNVYCSNNIQGCFYLRG